jgi:hypothetical protein
VVALTASPSATSGSKEATDRFSADHALRIVRRLCDEIGIRANGTLSHARAADMLAEELRTIPGVEVELQYPSGVHRYKKPPFPFPPFVYKTTNVVARLPGRTQEALLLNAHYDTATDSVGAGDDALGVAVMVETLRVLANGPKLEHSIVVNLNGDEELGMLGAAGFLQHRFAKDVRAYLYIDSGPRGKTLVLGTGPGNAWLLKEYANAGRSISATVIGEDLVSSGLLPHSGDFLPFHEAGLIGIDLAAIDDFWSVHTDRDRPERIDQTTIQLMGDNLLAGARRLANGPLPGNVDKAHFIYYDVLGLSVLIYGLTTARVLALIALGLALFVLVLAIRRKAFTLRQLLGAFGRLMLMVLAAILGAILIALLLGFGLRRPHGWFSSPLLAVWVFGMSSVAAALAILFWRRRCRPDEPDLVAWAGGLCFWALLLMLTTYANIGAAYFALWWTLGMAVGLLGTLFVPKWRGAWWLVSFLPGAALVISTVVMIFPFLVGDTGLVAAPIPLDSVIAIFIAFAVVMLLPSLVAAINVSSRLGRVSLGCGIIALVGAIVTAVVNPYSVERPKRIQASLVQGEDASGMYLSSHDALPLGPALRNVPEATPLSTPLRVPKDAPFTYRIPAGKPSFAAPILQVLSSSYHPEKNVRTVQVRLDTDPPVLWFFVPRAALRGWSFGELPNNSADPTRFIALFEDATPKNKEFTLELTGSDPVEVEMIGIQGPSYAQEIIELKKKLPPWTALTSSEIWSVKQKI